MVPKYTATTEILIPTTGRAELKPYMVNNLKWWAMANSGVYQTSGGAFATGNGETVGEIRDQSSNNNILFQNDSDKYPSYIVSGQANLPVIRSDGVDDILSTQNVISTKTDNITTVVACRSLSENGGSNTLFAQGAANNGNSLTYSNAGDGFANRQLLYNGDTFINTGTVQYRTFEIVSYKKETGITTLRVNGVDQPVNSPTQTFTTPTGNTSILGDAGGSYGNFDFGEGFMYDVALSPWDLERLENYLLNKWGVS